MQRDSSGVVLFCQVRPCLVVTEDRKLASAGPNVVGVFVLRVRGVTNGLGVDPYLSGAISSTLPMNLVLTDCL